MMADSMTRPNHRQSQRTDFLIVNRRREEENRNKMRETTNYYAQTARQVCIYVHFFDMRLAGWRVKCLDQV